MTSISIENVNNEIKLKKRWYPGSSRMYPTV